MKHLISLIFILTISFSFAQKKEWLDSEFEPTKKKFASFYFDEKQEGDKTIKTIYSLSDNKYNYYTYQYGILNGGYALYYYNGSVKEEGFYKHGVKNGVVYFYNKNGYIEKKEQYKRGYLDGYSINYWYNTLIKKDSVFYFKDLKEGVGFVYYYNGDLEYKITYSKDKKNGIQIGYYDSGKVKDSVFFINDKENGMLYSYYESGKFYYSKFYKDGKIEGNVVSYWEDGSKLDSSFYRNGELNGKKISWYKNGKIDKDIDFLNGDISGDLITYWSNGNMKRKDLYKNGNLIEGSCYSSKGDDTTYYDYETIPEYIGGNEKLYEYLGKNIRYPKIAKKSGTKGKVYVQFVVDKDGQIKEAKVIRGIGDGCDDESLRIIKEMPKWSPGYLNGFPVRFKYTLPVVYQLR